jgi:DNA-binding response OmpR family regulator
MDEKPKILIVEDDEIVRKIIAEILVDDYDFDFAEDGEVALKLASERNPDLILLDIMIPKVDGFEVCKRLRKDPLHNKSIIILLTALTDKDSQKTGYNAGADDYITKPFNPVDIRNKVNSMFRLRNRLIN